MTSETTTSNFSAASSNSLRLAAKCEGSVIPLCSRMRTDREGETRWALFLRAALSHVMLRGTVVWTDL